MTRSFRFLVLGSLVAVFPLCAVAQSVDLHNDSIAATFNANGLVSVLRASSKTRIDLTSDGWSIRVDDAVLSSTDAQPQISRKSASEVQYAYTLKGYRVEVDYQVKSDWQFVGKTIRIVEAPSDAFTIHEVTPWKILLRNPVESDFIPSVYVPQVGETIKESREHLPGKDFGVFLRMANDQGAMLTAQNPYLHVLRNGQSVSISYSPEMKWQKEWGDFSADTACIDTYTLTGRRKPRSMVLEWHLDTNAPAQDGMDDAEIRAFSDCVGAFLIHPSPQPISVEVGWTLNDYQIDVGTKAGQDEYKRIINMASQLGIQTLLYAPGNSNLSSRDESTDTWKWEYVLWLGLGEKIRKGEWDPTKDPVPSSVSSMVEYAKDKNVGLLAYVYPSIPFSENSSWLVKGGRNERGSSFGDPHATYASLASRQLQDYLIQNLIAFKRLTGIAGYSFDYTFLDLPGSSSYAQWYGWRRVIEALRRAYPSIVIDGRQSYQMYGPWSWLAGSYPHPTGTDEQPESFKPFPDLHFDRVSADRARFVNYWYRNYQFAPEEIIPGYATHQTERSRSIPGKDGQPARVEMMLTRYRARDWDYLGFKYSFISSIATGGWNSVVDMIPARDSEEARYFSSAAKAWIRGWLDWTIENKNYLLHTRSILGQPALGRVDGTAAIDGDSGFLFVFNPNYKQMQAQIKLDASIGLTNGNEYLIEEIYPEKGQLLGKPNAGLWSRGDTVQLTLDGTSATVYRIKPAESIEHPLLFNSASVQAEGAPSATLQGSRLSIQHAAGEPGTAHLLGVLLPDEEHISEVSVNGVKTEFSQSGQYIQTEVKFSGKRFAQAQELELTHSSDNTYDGNFLIPNRIFEQLRARRQRWPIHWTAEDLKTTWLAPERLLLYVQFANLEDSQRITAEIDGRPVRLTPAYTSTRVVHACFVGYYADLSGIKPDVRHTIQLRADGLAPGQLQGVFFDNVLPQYVESISTQ